MPRFLKNPLVVLFLGLTLLTAAGCAKAPGPSGPQAGRDVADLRNLPQDLKRYVEPGKADRAMLTPEQAQARTWQFLEKQFEPWTRDKASYSLKSVAEPYAAYRKSPGFDETNQPRDPSFAQNLERLSNFGRYPSMAQKAVTVRNADLRVMPARGARYDDPSQPGEGYPFDYLQQSVVAVNTPILVTHASTDGAWLLVETPFTFGWLPAEAAAFVDEAFESAFRTTGYAAVIRDNAPLAQTPGLTADVGAVFPLTGLTEGGFEVLYAVRGADGRAEARRAVLQRGQAVSLPMPLTENNVAAVGNVMMGQAYGWGGLDDKRDCSSMTKDLFAPFGLWLPRNSSAQAKAYPTMSLEGLSPEQKEEAIVRRGVPFATLLWMKGHIMLYVGQAKGHPLIFHNVWGLRTLEPDGKEGRLVIGKAVVTSLRAGEDLPQVGPQKIWINRILAMTFLAGRP